MAAALAETGKRILVLEKGDHLRPSMHDRDAKSIFAKGHYRPDETWLDGKGQSFNPGNYYYVGGNSKFFGAVFLRYRREDFSPIAHMGGTSPGWPITYDALEPFYGRAEMLYQVRGQIGEDPTEPDHATLYPHPPLADEPGIAEFRRRISGSAQTKMEDRGSLWDDDGAGLRTMTLQSFLDVTRLGNCLCILDGRVLDITDFASSHPGGPEMLRYVRGSDITEEFLGKRDVDGIHHLHRYVRSAITQLSTC